MLSSKDIIIYKKEILSLKTEHLALISRTITTVTPGGGTALLQAQWRKMGRCQVADAVSWDEEGTLDMCVRVCVYGNSVGLG